MNYISEDVIRPPRILNWKQQLDQQYECDQNLLITGGCSFTNSTNQTQSAASWPGFVKDRCGFKKCVDMSLFAMGNRYIADSIKYAIENLVKNANPLVVVMWSGLDRNDVVVQETAEPVNVSLGDTTYQVSLNKNKQQSIDQSVDNILDLKQYLESKNIQYVFTTYINLFDPPYIPVRDTTYRFTDYKDNVKLSEVKQIQWVPVDKQQCLYEWAFYNDYFDDTTDYYHPPVNANLKWTDDVLLPEMCNQGLLKKLTSN